MNYAWNRTLDVDVRTAWDRFCRALKALEPEPRAWHATDTLSAAPPSDRFALVHRAIGCSRSAHLHGELYKETPILMTVVCANDLTTVSYGFEGTTVTLSVNGSTAIKVVGEDMSLMLRLAAAACPDEVYDMMRFAGEVTTIEGAGV